MRNVKLVLLIAVMLSGQTAMGLQEFNLVLDTDNLIAHYYEPGDQYMDSYIEEHISIHLPAADLSPGELYRANISFINGGLLKIINGTQAMGISIDFATGSVVGIGVTKTNNAITALNITESRDINNTSQTGSPACSLWNGKVYSFSEGFSFSRSNGDIVDGSLLKRFTIEFSAPTVVAREPFIAYTYNSNWVSLNFLLLDPTSDKNLVQIVACMDQQRADIDGNCMVDFRDFAIMASEWLTCNLDDQAFCWQ